ncbi:MAG: HU family DNA-binding protein [Bacilli bacterium]|nr:HU family DNA-binding protein [Bacilli bacterium]
MNKTELVEKVAAKTELPKKDAEAAIEAVLEVIEEALVAGEAVKLSGFGIFSKKERAAREGTNPANQEKIEIPASATVAFKVSKALKEKLN